MKKIDYTKTANDILDRHKVYGFEQNIGKLRFYQGVATDVLDKWLKDTKKENK